MPRYFIILILITDTAFSSSVIIYASLTSWLFTTTRPRTCVRHSQAGFLAATCSFVPELSSPLGRENDSTWRLSYLTFQSCGQSPESLDSRGTLSWYCAGSPTLQKHMYSDSVQGNLAPTVNQNYHVSRLYYIHKESYEYSFLFCRKMSPTPK